jgi:hypothetical protein
MLKELFTKRYMESLGFYRHFYDDVCKYGSEDNPGKVFYFIPGISGTPGQIRFSFPSFFKRYGTDFYMHCCHLDEFSARCPIWEKYKVENIDKKRRVITDDLKQLSGRYGEVVVIASSNGFYDFVHAYDGLRKAGIAGNLKLLWVACAPDSFLESAWETVFFPLNGFVHNSYRWFAYPNHQLLRFLNPETTTKFKWRYQHQGKTIYKADLENRFVCFNLYWDYVSIDCFNAMLRHALRDFSGIMDIETHVLVASNDGFWQGRGEDQVKAIVGKYVKVGSLLFKDASHLWVASPENICELLDCLSE